MIPVEVLVLLVPLILLIAIVQWRKGALQPDEVASTSRSPDDAGNLTAASAAATEQEVQPLEQEGAQGQTENPSTGSPANHRSGPLSLEPGDELESPEWDGAWLTSAAMEKPSMAELAATDPSYDGAVEARQLFHPFERDLRSAEPLDSTSYRALLSKHKAGNAGTLKRVMDLRSQGRDQAATDLYQEWSRLFELYRKKAYPQDSPK